MRERRRSPRLFTAAVLTATASAAIAAGAAPQDTSRYSVLAPTPRGQMRELSTDRPDKTESPYTVDAGHFQLEMDLVTYTHDHDTSGGADTKVDTWVIAPINIKVGLCNRVDLQTVIATYSHVRADDDVTGNHSTQRGFGDVVSRLKVNIWGNDGGATALAIMPFVKYPTAQDHLGNDEFEGGVIVPLAVELPAGWGMGVMTELDVARDEVGDGYHAESVNSITFAHDIVGELGGYAEFWSLVSSQRDTQWVGTFDVGLTYGLSENVQLDAGINIGLTDSADDVNPFVGLSIRY